MMPTGHPSIDPEHDARGLFRAANPPRIAIGISKFDIYAWDRNSW